MRTLFGEWTPLDAARLLNANASVSGGLVQAEGELHHAGIRIPDARYRTEGMPQGFWQFGGQTWTDTSRGPKTVEFATIQAGHYADKLSTIPGAAADVKAIRDAIYQMRAEHQVTALVAETKSRYPGT